MNDLKFTTAGDYMKMNERIKELAGQANLKLDELSDDTFIPLEKFAELIIQKCCAIADEAERADVPVVASKFIKAHFGVEE